MKRRISGLQSAAWIAAGFTVLASLGCTERQQSSAGEATEVAFDVSSTETIVPAAPRPSATPTGARDVAAALAKLDAPEIVKRIHEGGVSEDESRMLDLLANLPLSREWPRPSDDELNWLLGSFPSGLPATDYEFLRAAYGVDKSALLTVEETETQYSKFYAPLVPAQRRLMLEQGFVRLLDRRALGALGSFSVGELKFYPYRMNAAGMLVQSQNSLGVAETSADVVRFASCLRPNLWDKVISTASRISVVDAARFSETPEWSQVYGRYSQADATTHLEAAAGIQFRLGGSTQQVILRREAVVSEYGRSVVYHELGHMLYDFLDGDEAETARRAAEGAVQSGRWTGTYAATNSEEMFAEGVAIYLGAYSDTFTVGPRDASSLSRREPDLAAVVASLFVCNPSGAT